MREEKQKKISNDEFEYLNKTILEMSNKAEKTEEKHSKNNIFYILGVQDFEIRHSDFLMWLLQNDKAFTRNFLTNKKICGISSELACKMTSKDYVVAREYKKDLNGKSIDLLLDFKDEKIVIVIENKWGSEEGKSQLFDYYNYIENSPDFEGYKKLYLFLTINGVSPKMEEDAKHYKSVSYRSILDILDKHLKSKKQTEKSLIIDNYIEVLKERTKIVMDRVKIYYDMFEKNKDIMEEMAQYIPNINKRAEIERSIVKSIDGLSVESDKQNAYVVIEQNEIVDICERNGLPKYWVYFQIVNDKNKMTIQFIIVYDKDEKYKRFSKEFRSMFGKEDKSKSESYAHLWGETLVVSNKSSGYLTEEELQAKIREELIKYFTDPNSMYFKILDFVRNYKF